MAVHSKCLQVIIWFLDWWGRERRVIIALGLCWCNSHLLETSASPLPTKDVPADRTGQRGSSHSFKSQDVSFWKTDHFPRRGRHFFNQEKRSSCHHQDIQTISRFLWFPGKRAEFQFNSQLQHPLSTNLSSGLLSKSQIDRFRFLFLLPTLWQDLNEQLTSWK